MLSRRQQVMVEWPVRDSGEKHDIPAVGVNYENVMGREQRTLK